MEARVTEIDSIFFLNVDIALLQILVQSKRLCVCERDIFARCVYPVVYFQILQLNGGATLAK
jgi:hypothetical protein